MAKGSMIEQIEKTLMAKMRKEDPHTYDVGCVAESKVDALVEYLALLAERVYNGEDPLGIKDGRRGFASKGDTREAQF